MSLKLIDVHTHTQFTAFDADRDAVIKCTLDAGVWMINVGTQRDTSKSAIDTAHSYAEGVFATVGLHPIHTEKSFHDAEELGASEEVKGFSSRGDEFDHSYYKNLAADPKVVAIGECGLDYYRLTENTKEKQKKVFIKQIELASEVGKPLMIHCREAFGDLINILEENLTSPPTPLLRKEGGEKEGDERGRLRSPGIIHFFSGTEEDAKKLIDLGFSFSFGGVVTFARAYEKLVKFVGLERICLETDAPDVAPIPHRGKRNEPLYVEEVSKKIASILEKDFDEVAAVTTENAIKIFNLK